MLVLQIEPKLYFYEAPFNSILWLEAWLGLAWKDVILVCPISDLAKSACSSRGDY